MNKILKFFKDNNFMVKNTSETKRYHISHSKSDRIISLISVTIDGNDYLFENPLSGSKTYYLTDDKGIVLNNGSVTTLGFSQQQFIDNVKEYFNIK